MDEEKDFEMKNLFHINIESQNTFLWCAVVSFIHPWIAIMAE